MSDETLPQLNEAVERGSLMLEMLKSRGFQEVFHPWLQGKINDNKNIWLSADREKAEEIRIKSKVYLEVYQFINGCIQLGEVAKQTEKELKQ